MHYIDSLLGGVVDDLERRKLLDRTVIIVTSDHGMEFDDSGLGFTGHSTAYSEYQIHTPLVVRWPGRPPGRVTRRTSHNDIAPTLLTELFGCTNPPSDYSSGYSLFSDSRVELAHRRQLQRLRRGRARPRDRGPARGLRDAGQDYHLVPNPTLPRDALRAAMLEMSRFYR